MANEKNLIPFDERTESEQREIASAGGRASGAARRRKRSLKEAADLFLSLPVSDKRRWNKLSRAGVDPEDIDNQMAVIAGLTLNAMNGDSKAAKVLFELLGEDAKESNAETNLLEAIAEASEGEVSTDDLSEIEQEAAFGDDMVEPSEAL